MTIKIKQLVQAELASTSVAGSIVDALNEACVKFGIDSPRRIAGFLSQCAHESAGFTRTIENLNYGAAGLLKTWPKRFTEQTAQECAHKPEQIANKVYSSRMGNGDEASGDGWRYRGRGYLQVTGKAGYRLAEIALGEKFVEHPELLAAPKWAALSAARYWSANGLNALADTKDVVGITKRINGGSNGLQERQELFEKALAVFE